MNKIFTLLLLIASGTLSYGQNNCWLKIASANGHTIAIASDGTLWSWGNNPSGQLGLGDTTVRIAPTQIGTDNDWQSISPSSAIKTNGTLWVWGSNNNGQLGLGDTTNRLSPIQLGTDTNWLSTTVGSSAHSLAIKTDGTLWSWGYGASGQLGLGGIYSVSTPTQVGTATNWKSISTGSNHSLAIKTDNTLWVWGRNASRELGITATENQTAPVVRGNTWLSASASDLFSLAVRSDGTLWAWGTNGFGQLGIGNNSSPFQPTRVGTDTDWTKVVTGTYHTIAIKNNGTLWAWGYNNYGQLGLGTIDGDHFSPAQIGTATDWLDIEAGSYFGVARKSSGEISAWGKNDLGQLGLGNTTNNSNLTVVNCPTTLSSASFNAQNLKVYPNPVKDILTVSNDGEITSAAIYNLLGQEVLAKAINANEDTIDVSSLQSGTYLIKVTSDNAVKTLKFIKK
ncbi:MAG TPA: T9SS type A sorting domain-containing protein [Flavobacterium sp.]|uniref:T9SS type A sorting domain-containing protein n=1 Tax=Flavobacterium sp. TaxID=239 RepID=UPI002C9BD438|nr:T9SS type A sorting domain-containing protein [Flavobacterium sp.]HSD13671.1 T9SS type A sorting domain-containing protein [Flavobacterium sp.]